MSTGHRSNTNSSIAALRTLSIATINDFLSALSGLPVNRLLRTGEPDDHLKWWTVNLPAIFIPIRSSPLSVKLLAENLATALPVPVQQQINPIEHKHRYRYVPLALVQH